jgi:hypothetical protein
LATARELLAPIGAGELSSDMTCRKTALWDRGLNEGPGRVAEVVTRPPLRPRTFRRANLRTISMAVLSRELDLVTKLPA